MHREPIRPSGRPTLMTRKLRSRRMAFVGAVLVLGLTACGTPADEGSPAASVAITAAASPPVIQIDGSQSGTAEASGRSAAPMAAADAPADSKMMPAYITYVYDGALTDLTAPAASWF